MKKENIRTRMDITFWLAILVLLATMLSRYAGKIQTLDINPISAGIEVPVTGQNPDS